MFEDRITALNKDTEATVSYTHLDVYKRQVQRQSVPLASAIQIKRW